MLRIKNNVPFLWLPLLAQDQGGGYFGVKVKEMIQGRGSQSQQNP